MAQGDLSLQAELRLDLGQFQRSINEAANRFRDLGSKLQSVGKSLSTYVTLPLTAMGGVAVANAIKFEKLATSLNVLTGSAEAGAVAFERLKKFSASTPFQLDELVSVNNTLMGFGLNADQAFGSLKMLGDIASVSGANLANVAVAFGQSAAAGRVMTQDLNQFINNGIPIYQLLEDVTGKNVGELRELASQGAITFDILEQAFQKGTSEGGKFFEGTLKLSQTLGGRLSTLRDNFNLMMSDIGALIGKALSPLIDIVTGLFQAFQSLSDTTKTVIVVVAGVAAAIGPLLIGIGAVMNILPLLIGGLSTLTTVFHALISPVGLVIGAILSLVATGLYMWDNWELIGQYLTNLWINIKNGVLSMAQFVLEKIGKLVEGLIVLGAAVGIHFNNPMSKLVNLLEDAKSETVEITGEFGSFKDALKNAAVNLGLIKPKVEEVTSSLNKGTTAAKNFNNALSGGTSGATSDELIPFDDVDTSGFMSDSVKGMKQYDDALTSTKLSTEALGVATSGVTSDIIRSLGVLSGKTKGFALFEIAANTAIGLAKAIQAGAGIPFPANLGAIAAGTGAVLSGMAGAKQTLSKAPAFASGGIVSGQSTSGDRVLARVNSGEMILNSGQQANLFKMANGQGSGQSVLSTRVSGGDLLFVLENARNRRTRNSGY